MDKIIFSDEQIQEMLKLKQMGKYNKDIADKFNVSASTIGRLMRQNNIITHPRLSEEIKQRVCDLYLQGCNQSQIANQLSITSRSVSQVLNENNISKRSMSQIKRSYSLDVNYFDNIDTPNKAYILGLLYADGCLNQHTNLITISLQETDKDILEKIQYELKTNIPLKLLPYHKQNPNWQNQYNLCIVDQHLYESLLKAGLSPCKSLVLSFPEWLNENLYSHFMRGYFDGDGSIFKFEKRASFICTNTFADFIVPYLEEKLDIHFSISKCHHSEKPTRDCRVAGNYQVSKFLNWLYSDAELYIERKYNLYQQLYVNNFSQTE